MKEFENNNEIQIELIFKENEKKNYLGKYKNINCEYKIKNMIFDKNVKNMIFKDEDILNNNNYKQFDVLYNKLNFSNDIISNIKSNFPGSSSQDALNYIVNTLEVASPYEILKFLKIIGIHLGSANYIKELSNGVFVSGEENNLYFYDYLIFKKSKEIKIQNYNIYENKNENDEVELIVYLNEIKRLIINKYLSITMPKESIIKSTRIYFNNAKNDLIGNDKGFFHFYNLFENTIKTSEMMIIDISFWGGIKINNYIYALTSNKIVKKGKDKIIFYNISSKIIIKEIDNYSFVLYPNNLTLITPNNKNNNKILLCACKKYIKSQKNGILLLKLEINNDINISKIFYDTGKFEVYCFCQIFKFNILNEIMILKRYKKIMIETEYFLVGGFDTIKRKGLIKLYRLNYNNDNFNLTDIKYIQDIDIKKKYKKDLIIEKNINNEKNSENFFNFKGFKGPITCITQSKFTGNILITCLDGNVYLFTFPNIIKLIKLNKEK